MKMNRLRPLCFLLAAAILAGCGKEMPTNPETTTIVETVTIETAIPQSTAAGLEIVVRLEETEIEAAQLYDQLIHDSSLTQADMNDLSYEIYQVWDALLNEIWQQLSTALPEADMQTLTAAERQWIQEKEAAINRSAAAYGEGSLSVSTANQHGAAMTRERVYVLAGLLVGQELSMAPEYDAYYPAVVTTPLMQALFLPLAEGWHILDYEVFLISAQELGLSVIEDEGLFRIDDPDASGSYLFGSLTTENESLQIAQLGYSRAVASGDRSIRVDFADDTEHYFISAVFWDDGTPVDTLQEMITYLSQ